MGGGGGGGRRYVNGSERSYIHVWDVRSEGRNMWRETLSAEPELMCTHACLHTQGTYNDHSD